MPRQDECVFIPGDRVRPHSGDTEHRGTVVQILPGWWVQVEWDNPEHGLLTEHPADLEHVRSHVG